MSNNVAHSSQDPTDSAVPRFDDASLGAIVTVTKDGWTIVKASANVIVSAKGTAHVHLDSRAQRLADNHSRKKSDGQPHARTGAMAAAI